MTAPSPPPLMVLGTSSGVGKSLITAGLCRLLRRRGEQPVPFKGQNMSLNAYVDEDGGEMAYAQAMQAWAAGLTPCAAMNPVLLKPCGHGSSEVIHLGRSVGVSRAEDYYRDWFRPGWLAIRQGLDICQQRQGRLLLEGAGSPVEVNLQARDLTNLRLAQFLRARCVLVADIERGGVFAQIIGTLQLLRPVERSLMAGLLINRFRGQRSLFDEGRLWLERRTGLPVLGVLPWLGERFPPEDSLDLLERQARKPEAELRLAVLRLPSISNFSDVDPLAAEATVQVDWLLPTDTIDKYDAVLLPGSKQTMADLKAMQAARMDGRLQRYVAAGGVVLAICGGLQMLGQRLHDPHGLEGETPGDMEGLGLLPLVTTFRPGKVQRQWDTTTTWPESGQPCTGFELHHGQTTALTHGVQPLYAQPGLGWVSPCGRVVGTYLHGCLEAGPWRRHWLNWLRRRRGLPPLPTAIPHHGAQRDRLMDRLADALAEDVNLEPLLR